MPKVDNIVKTLHPLERRVLPLLRDGIRVEEIIKITGMQEVEVMRALQWLRNKKIVNIETSLKEIISLDKNGEIYIKKGLPERRFLAFLTKDMSLEELKSRITLSKDEIKACLGILRRKAAIEVKDCTIISATNNGRKLLASEMLEEKFLNKLPLDKSKLNDEDKFVYGELSRRKNIIKTDLVKDRVVHLEKIAKSIQKIDLSEIERYYDVTAPVPRINYGKRHFVNEALEYVKQIWLDMGFKEMTGSLLCTSFWDFDALFTAQDHPVREMQDTFFVKNPKYGKLPNQDVVNKIKETHENGGDTGSKGWQYNWSSEEAQKNVLRTHTTILSAQTIAKLKKSDLPAKFFAVGKCFRNETMDFSHLFEFNQTEGIVVDENANFKHLLGYLKEFANKMGYSKIRFRPAYFPYTEMSLEGDVYDPVRKKWMEIIAAGIFRPEVVKPLLGVDVPVLAWGPGVDRMIMGAYNIKDIRELYNNDLKKLREVKKFLK